jgi:hypothetical protein
MLDSARQEQGKMEEEETGDQRDGVMVKIKHE